MDGNHQHGCSRAPVHASPINHGPPYRYFNLGLKLEAFVDGNRQFTRELCPGPKRKQCFGTLTLAMLLNRQGLVRLSGFEFGEIGRGATALVGFRGAYLVAYRGVAHPLEPSFGYCSPESFFTSPVQRFAAALLTAWMHAASE